jgi:hypothetical protein
MVVLTGRDHSSPAGDKSGRMIISSYGIKALETLASRESPHARCRAQAGHLAQGESVTLISPVGGTFTEYQLGSFTGYQLRSTLGSDVLDSES